jgi:hypothetical protein
MRPQQVSVRLRVDTMTDKAPSKRSIQVPPFNGSLQVFKDHFPGAPLVPAFMQIALIREVFFSTYGSDAKRFSFRFIKFTSQLLPDTPVTITFENRISGGTAFTLESGEDVVSAGEIRAG